MQYKVSIGNNEEFEKLISDLLSIVHPEKISCLIVFFVNDIVFTSDRVLGYGNKTSRTSREERLLDVIAQLFAIYRPTNITKNNFSFEIYDNGKHLSDVYASARERIYFRDNIKKRLLQIGIKKEDIKGLFQ